MISLWTAILIALVGSVFMTIATYPYRRAKIEATCIKETKLKTFADEMIINFILSLLLVSVIIITYILLGVFE